MKIINLVQLIKDYNTFFYPFVLDDSGISEILEDIKYKYGESCIEEGDTFCLEHKKYIENSFGSLDAQIILFNFKLISKKYKYIIDEDTGEQVFDEVIEEVVEYLGFN